MNEKKSRDVSFEYKISPNFHVYSVNGAYGGVNADGEIIMNLFSERPAIPRHETYGVKEDGTLESQPKDQEKKDYIIRDVMFGVSMNPQTAKSLANWLQDRITAYERMLKESKAKAHADD